MSSLQQHARSARSSMTWPPLVERLLISPLRPMRFTILCKPEGVRQRPSDTFTRGVRGHLVAFPGPPAKHLAECFPCPLDQVPSLLNVSYCSKRQGSPFCLSLACTKAHVCCCFVVSPLCLCYICRWSSFMQHLRKKVSAAHCSRVQPSK